MAVIGAVGRRGLRESGVVDLDGRVLGSRSALVAVSDREEAVGRVGGGSVEAS